MRRSRPSSLPAAALVIACLALVAAVAGSAYAAAVFTGRDIKNNTVTGADIKDGSLRGSDTLVRVASAQRPDDTATSLDGRKRLLQLAIDAPARGYLAITASADLANPAESDNPACWIVVDHKASATSLRRTGLDAGSGGVNLEENCDTNVVEPVRRGPHTVELRARGGSAETAVHASSLRAIFIPFGATGIPPTEFEITKAASGRPLAGR